MKQKRGGKRLAGESATHAAANPAALHALHKLSVHMEHHNWRALGGCCDFPWVRLGDAIRTDVERIRELEARVAELERSGSE